LILSGIGFAGLEPVHEPSHGLKAPGDLLGLRKESSHPGGTFPRLGTILRQRAEVVVVGLRESFAAGHRGKTYCGYQAEQCEEESLVHGGRISDKVREKSRETQAPR